MYKNEIKGIVSGQGSNQMLLKELDYCYSWCEFIANDFTIEIEKVSWH